MSEQQTYQNHTRYFPLVHFVLFPALFFNLIWQIVRLYQEPNWDRAEWVFMAVVFVAMNVAARLQALKAQDRVIRLEEELRFNQILPKELLQKAAGLKTSQLIALRFASDEELPNLIERALNDEFKTGKDIKLAIKNWRGDYLRV